MDKTDKYLSLTMKYVLDALKEKDSLYKVVYYGILALNGCCDNFDILDIESIQNYFYFTEAIREYMKMLTPNELMRIFPVKKTYDGEKYEMKDYFYTMAVLRKHGLDSPLSESLDDIIWNYQNHNIRVFMVNIMSIASKLYEHQTGINPTVQFFNDMGVQSYTMHQDPQTGKKYMVNNAGRSFKVIERELRKPNYIKVIK